MKEQWKATPPRALLEEPHIMVYFEATASNQLVQAVDRVIRRFL